MRDQLLRHDLTMVSLTSKMALLLHQYEGAAGHHEIPYTAYKLLRLLTRQELAGTAWAGWHITAGVLWSPEGHGFKPQDSNW